jgi:hypothetical protein
MAGEEEQNHPPPPQPGQVMLAAFWPQAPTLWFEQAECTLAVKHMVAQFDRYCHVVAALPHESIRLVADIVENEPSETPYYDIKQRLVPSHQLSDFPKAERLFQMPALAGRKPSELKAAMLETCPRGEAKTCLHLPSEAAKGDPGPVGQGRPQGPEDAGDSGGRAVGPLRQQWRWRGSRAGESGGGFRGHHLWCQAAWRPCLPREDSRRRVLPGR